jgi:hypothetical protein
MNWNVTPTVDAEARRLADPTVRVNPWAHRPSNLVASLPFRRIEHDENGTRREILARQSIAEVLGLPLDWPRLGDAWDD